MLTIRTLGHFDVLLNGVSLLESTEIKRGLFVVYLAEQKQPQLRIDAGRLFWPKVEDKAVQVNLRSLLLRLRREGLADYLEADRSTVALTNWETIEFDVAQLRALTTKGKEPQFAELLSAAHLYEGRFLENIVIDEYSRLNDWASAVRVEIELRMVQALSRLVSSAIQADRSEEILPYAERLVAIAPYDDASHALYMQALAAAERISDALNHFYQYRRQLREESQTDVGRELIEVMARLTRPNLFSVTAQTDPKTRAEEILSFQEKISHERHFPHIEHPMIGRTHEAEQLRAHLERGIRLVTVMGIGGTGKTFFVRSQYPQLSERFGKNLYYADLRSNSVTPDNASNSLLLTIAAAISLSLEAGKPLLTQVAEALYGKKNCLILDNFETVQPAAMTVLDLLKAIPELTILVTSRERLNLSMEAVLPLSGLSQTPSAHDNGMAQADTASSQDDLSRYNTDAVRYFLHCVRRHDITYGGDAETLLWIQQICREVEALPLAIELTAMQVPFFRLPELIERLRQDRTILAGEYGDLPGDHYSVWAVLDNMWETLSETERRVLAEMSVFAGAFHRDAMTSVTPAERGVYIRLINASLLRTEEPAWFSLHSLVKQYATQRLTSDEAGQRHARYFLEMFAGGVRMREGLVAQQLPVPPLAVRCHADSALAWQWAVDHAEWELLDRALLRLSRYLNITNQEQELAQYMQQLLDALPPVEERNQRQHRLAGRAAYNLANCNRLSDVTMKFWWEHSLSWLEAADDAWDLAAAVLAYADTLFIHSRSWDRIESLLAQAQSLIDQYPAQLEPLRVVSDFTACTYYLYQGEWANLRHVQKALVTRMAHPAHSTAFEGHLLYATSLDDWEQVSWLIERLQLDNKDSLGLPTWQQWATHHLCSATANAGDITGAIAQRLSILDGYGHVSDRLLPLAYAELALWQHLVGDTDAAEASATKALAYAQQPMERLYAAFGQLFVGAFYTLKGDQARAIPLLHTVLDFGRQLHHPTMIFSALYYLAQIHADQLPADLVERILKIGAVSPAMHFVLRPLARQHLAAQGLVLTDEERTTLWATDMKAVQALVDEVMKRIS